MLVGAPDAAGQTVDEAFVVVAPLASAIRDIVPVDSIHQTSPFLLTIVPQVESIS
jgi:hypothetical protein